MSRTDYEHGYARALEDALYVLDGHNLNDTAHDRVKRLRACGECGHQPERHLKREHCIELVGFPGRGYPCSCAEYEPVAR